MNLENLLKSMGLKMSNAMINKEKVNEILADMKEEERKKQEAIEAEVDKFLENRLEYYVAMVMNGMIYYEISLLHILNNDGCNLPFEAKDKINEALEEFGWYLFLKSRYDFDLYYMHISDAKNDIPQPTNVGERQIELGLRKIEVERTTYKSNINNYRLVAIVLLVALVLVLILCTH